MKTKTKALLALLAFAAIIMVSDNSCSTVKKYAAFDVTYNLPKASFKYPSGILKSGEVILYSGQNNINLDSLLMAHDIPSGWIASASFSQFSITITAPPEANFGWLQSARAIASSDAGFNPNVELGNVANNDSTAKTVNLTLNNLELQPYIHKTIFYYEVLGTLRYTPSFQITMDLISQLKLHIEPL